MEWDAHQKAALTSEAPVRVFVGPRMSGKSTLCQHVIAREAAFTDHTVHVHSPYYLMLKNLLEGLYRRFGDSEYFPTLETSSGHTSGGLVANMLHYSRNSILVVDNADHVIGINQRFLNDLVGAGFRLFVTATPNTVAQNSLTNILVWAALNPSLASVHYSRITYGFRGQTQRDLLREMTTLSFMTEYLGKFYEGE